jgi:lipopolysaccharide biosynthesis glycosyltransferase
MSAVLKNELEDRGPAQRVVAALAADDNFTRPLAATVQSVVAHLSEGRTVDLYICDMGIAERNRTVIESVATHSAVTLHWLTLPDQPTELLPPSGFDHISKATYARLFLPLVLPHDTSRVLYLDSDLLAQRCIGDLFDLPMGDSVVLAVPDAASPFVSSPYGVPNWAHHGRRADELNFNAGVLLMNLTKWRDEQVTQDAVAYLTSGRHHGMGDQEAINAVLSGRIGEIDPRWNQQTEHYNVTFQATLPYGEDDLLALIKDPWMVHFTTNVKAWTFGSQHPLRDEWFAALDETPYRGWRPKRPRRFAHRLTRLVGRLRAAVGRS